MAAVGVHLWSTYGFKQADVALELSAIMLGRIVKFRRGDQYEEMQGSDVAGKTTEAADDSGGQPNEQPDVTGNSTVPPKDTTPDGTFFHIVS